MLCLQTSEAVGLHLGLSRYSYENLRDLVLYAVHLWFEVSSGVILVDGDRITVLYVIRSWSLPYRWVRVWYGFIWLVNLRPCRGFAFQATAMATALVISVYCNVYIYFSWPNLWCYLFIKEFLVLVIFFWGISLYSFLCYSFSSQPTAARLASVTVIVFLFI